MPGIPQPTPKHTNIEYYSLQDKDPGECINALWYGRSGAGKTWTAGTAGPRTLFINTGDGIETLLSPAFRARYKAPILCVDVRERYRERGIVDAAQAFDLVSDIIDDALATRANDFDTVVLDDSTSLEDFALNKGLEVTQSKTLAKLERWGVRDPMLPDYKIEMNLTSQFFNHYKSKLKEAGKHWIVIAHEKYLYNKAEGMGSEQTIHRILPSFTGSKEPDRIPRIFDDVWRFDVVGSGENTSYRLVTKGNELVTARTRHGGVFKPVEADANFLELIQRIRSGNALHTKPNRS